MVPYELRGRSRNGDSVGIYLYAGSQLCELPEEKERTLFINGNSLTPCNGVISVVTPNDSFIVAVLEKRRTKIIVKR